MSNPSSPPPLFQLRSIYLRNSTIKVSDDFDPVTPNQPLVGKFRIIEGLASCREFQPTDSDGKPVRSCIFVTRFEFIYETKTQGNDDPTQVAQLTADIAADYLLLIDEIPDEPTLHRWSQTNVLLHVWPYWREYCQSTLLRMNFPTTVMPMIQIEPPQVEREDTSVQ